MKPAIAPLIARLSEWYARGEISLREAAHKAHAAGLADTLTSYAGPTRCYGAL
jgi:hypothetical protein